MSTSNKKSQPIISRGRVIKELGYRRTDLVITTKIFRGVREGPNTPTALVATVSFGISIPSFEENNNSL